jgi:hypothetical protein
MKKWVVRVRCQISSLLQQLKKKEGWGGVEKEKEKKREKWTKDPSCILLVSTFSR